MSLNGRHLGLTLPDSLCERNTAMAGGLGLEEGKDSQCERAGIGQGERSEMNRAGMRDRESYLWRMVTLLAYIALVHDVDRYETLKRSQRGAASGCESE